MREGIDVSKWQGIINWDAVKQSGKSFCLLKAAGSDSGFYNDRTFEQNYREAKRVGMLVGAYYFVGPGCTSYEAGVADAQRFIRVIQGKQFEYPLYIDFEAPGMADKNGNTEACIGFCETMEKNGYFAGIYSSDISGFVDRLHMDKLTAYSWWVARYGSKPQRATQNMHVWQKSSKGKVPGINGDVDLNESYVEFEKIIMERGLNGFPPRNVTEAARTLEQRVADLEARVNKLEGK